MTEGSFVGKQAQIRREKKEQFEKERKAFIQAAEKSKNPFADFWMRIDFWIYAFCFVLVVAFPFLVNNGVIKSVDTVQNKTAVIHTSKGDIDVEFYAKDAPKTVDNFVKLSQKGYYNNLTWHRVIKGFMIQGGDPTGDGTGGESAFGAPFADEISATALGLDQELVGNTASVYNQLSADDKTKYASYTVEQYYEQIKGYTYQNNLKSHHMKVGSLAMANSGPNTNGSQFFIVTEQDQPHLDGLHTVFGQVTKGLDIAKAISEVPVDDKDKPNDPVYITSVEVK